MNFSILNMLGVPLNPYAFPRQIPVPQIFCRKYHAYPPAFWNSENRDKLEKGDKIVVPASALDELTRMNIQFPIMFQIRHVSDLLPKISHCSVMEFTAPEGSVYLPMWMMDNLGLNATGESIIELTTVSLPKGDYVQFQAHETKFAMLSNPRVVLEKALRTYSCLTVGDTIQVEFNDYIYKLDVTDVNPKKRIGTAPYAVSIIETDIRVDFQEPRDYKDWEAKQKRHENINDNNNSFGVDQKYNNEEEEFANNNVAISSNNKKSYFEQLEASGSQALKLKERKPKKGSHFDNNNGNFYNDDDKFYKNNDNFYNDGNNKIQTQQNDYQNNNNNMPSKMTRGQPLGFPTTQTSNTTNNNISNGQTKKVEEVIGTMRYIYEIDENDNRKLIRRLPIRNLNADNKGYSLK